MASNSWIKARVAAIRKTLHQKYAAGWDLLSPEQQSNAMNSEVLALLLQQDLEKYDPAQEMVSEIMQALENQ